MKVIDDRVPAEALLITFQYPVDTRHVRLGDPAIADSILDCVMEGAHQFVLRGESVRRHRRPSLEASDAI